MKILIAGDTHGNTEHVITLLDVAKSKDCDRIFQVGDFGAWEHMGDGVKFFNDVNRHAEARGIPVYWLDGNHDKTSLVLEKYGDNRDEDGFLICRPFLKYAPRGHVWVWHGKTFMALGGAYSVDKDERLKKERAEAHKHGDDRTGRYWFPEEEMTDLELDEYLYNAPRHVDVLLTHDKPRSSNPGWHRKDLPECWPNQDRIEKAVQQLGPNLLVHGHLHFPYQHQIRNGEGWTTVVGLDSDPWSWSRGHHKHSWTILNLDPAIPAAEDDHPQLPEVLTDVPDQADTPLDELGDLPDSVLDRIAPTNGNILLASASFNSAI